MKSRAVFAINFSAMKHGHEHGHELCTLTGAHSHTITVQCGSLLVPDRQDELGVLVLVPGR